MAAAPGQVVRIDDGLCHIYFAFDVGDSIDLDRALQLHASDTPPERGGFHRPRRAPPYLQFEPRPVRMGLAGAPLTLRPPHETVADGDTEFQTESRVEATLFDFGAISVAYRIPIAGFSLERLLALASAAYESVELRTDARTRVETLVGRLGSAIRNPTIAKAVEDFTVYNVTRWSAGEGTASEAVIPSPTGVESLMRERAMLARILRGEPAELSPLEVEEALANRLSYQPHDLTLIDWNSALVVDEHGEDTLAVLEFANVELLEMRALDDRLDHVLDQYYASLPRARGLRRFSGNREQLRRLAALQMDNALLFEGINNALKLLGDQFLARAYRAAARRFHLAEWDASILRKLDVVQRLYEKLSDEQSARRMEVLEWIIIVLIAISIALPFLQH